MLEAGIAHDGLVTIGGAALARIPDLFRLFSDHKSKAREHEHAEAETAATMTLGWAREMRERIEALERQLADRDRAWAEREREFEMQLTRQRHDIRNLEMQIATLKVIADMDPGPVRDKAIDRLLRRLATPTVKAAGE